MIPPDAPVFGPIAWEVLLVTDAPQEKSKLLVYIVTAKNRDIAVDKCFRRLKEVFPTRSVKVYTAEPVDLDTPHLILQD